MYKASEILNGSILPESIENIQSNFGQWPMAWVEPIAYFGGGFRFATSEEITEDSERMEWDEDNQEYIIYKTQGYTVYNGFDVENNTPLSDFDCFTAICKKMQLQ